MSSAKPVTITCGLRRTVITATLDVGIAIGFRGWYSCHRFGGFDLAGPRNM